MSGISIPFDYVNPSRFELAIAISDLEPHILHVSVIEGLKDGYASIPYLVGPYDGSEIRRIMYDVSQQVEGKCIDSVLVHRIKERLIRDFEQALPDKFSGRVHTWRYSTDFSTGAVQEIHKGMHMWRTELH